jgi:hypothetical protein
MMLALQAQGCHNINWVTPEHVVPQILEAVPLAVAGGLRLPIVYNTSAYDSLDSLQLMDGVVDVYMPDFKVWSQPAARRYLRRPEYAEVARRAVREMHRQVGPLVVDSDGLARRGLLLRHLVMPGLLAEAEGVLRFVAEELGPDTYVDLMAQYYPAGLVGKGGRDGYAEIDRHLYREEYLRAVDVATAWGCGWTSAASPARPGWLPPTPRPDAAEQVARLFFNRPAATLTGPRPRVLDGTRSRWAYTRNGWKPLAAGGSAGCGTGPDGWGPEPLGQGGVAAAVAPGRAVSRSPWSADAGSRGRPATRSL